jgi:ketosteroid isomerase-like protein
MRTDAELVGTLISGLAAGDLDAIAAILTDDAEYVNPPYAMESGTRRGPEAVLAALATLIDTFDMNSVATTIEPRADEGTSESGPILLAWKGPIHMRTFGEALPNDGAFVFDRRGDRICRIAWFRDVAEARADLER